MEEIQTMKITKSKLIKIIKEEIAKTINEKISVRSYIKKPDLLSTTIPFGSLQDVLRKNPKLAKAVTNSADPRQQMQAIAGIKKAFADEEVPLSDGSRGRLGDLMDVENFIKDVEVAGKLRLAENYRDGADNSMADTVPHS